MAFPHMNIYNFHTDLNSTINCNLKHQSLHRALPSEQLLQRPGWQEQTDVGSLRGLHKKQTDSLQAVAGYLLYFFCGECKMQQHQELQHQQQRRRLGQHYYLNFQLLWLCGFLGTHPMEHLVLPRNRPCLHMPYLPLYHSGVGMMYCVRIII